MIKLVIDDGVAKVELAGDIEDLAKEAGGAVLALHGAIEEMGTNEASKKATSLLVRLTMAMAMQGLQDGEESSDTVYIGRSREEMKSKLTEIYHGNLDDFMED